MPAQRSKEQLVELVRKIMDCHGSEAELDECLHELSDCVPHPDVSDLIFYPEKPNITPEEIIEQALAYKPIALGNL